MTLLAQAAESASNGQTAETVLFWILAVLGVGAGIAMVTSRNIVHAALFLVTNFFAIAGLYLTLQSGFLSIVQIIVYAGAIMILFLFVIMLLGVDRDDLLLASSGGLQKFLAASAGVAFAAMLVSIFVGPYTTAASACGDQVTAEQLADASDDAVACVGLETLVAETDDGTVGVIGQRMFTRYTFPFETAALLLTVATLGALVLGRRHDPVEEPDLVLSDDDVAAARAHASGVAPLNDTTGSGTPVNEATASRAVTTERPAGEPTTSDVPPGEPLPGGPPANEREVD